MVFPRNRCRFSPPGQTARDQSDNAIAAQIGCSGSLVCKTRRQLMDQGCLEVSDTVIGKDGKTQTRRRKSKTNEKSARETKVSLSGEVVDLDQIVERMLTLQEHEANPSALYVKIVKSLYEGLLDKAQQKLFAVKAHVYLKNRLGNENEDVCYDEEQSN